MPSQKTGVEMPSTAAAISTWSRPRPGRAAARAPAPTPTTTETSVAARAESPCATGVTKVTGAAASPGEPDLAERRQELGRRRQRRSLEAPDVGLDEGPARVMIEGDPHRVVEDALLGLAVPRKARGARRHRVGLVEEAVDRRIPVAGGVAGGADVARVEEHRQEVLGIRIVGDPALPEEARRPLVDELYMGRPVEAP